LFKNSLHKNDFLNKQINKNCLYIHIPKTAGFSVKKGLFNSDGSYHYSFQNYESIYKPRFIKKAFKFTFVRHPVSRVYSAYNYLNKGGGNPIDEAFYETYMSDFSGFEDFVNNGLVNQGIIQKYIHFRSQKSFLINSKNEISIDFIGKLETLQEDFTYIKHRLKIETSLPQLNLTGKPIIEVKELQLSNQTLMNIFNLYEDDYQIFNYSWSTSLK
jgi:hypothetical protein